MPLLSLDAEKMVDAVIKGKRVAFVSVLSHLASRAHGLAPNLTVRLNKVLSLLPPKGTSSEAVSGEEAPRGNET